MSNNLRGIPNDVEVAAIHAVGQIVAAGIEPTVVTHYKDPEGPHAIGVKNLTEVLLNVFTEKGLIEDRPKVK